MRFKIIGTHRVAGVDPGGTVELDEDDPRTTALLRAGHLEPVKKKDKTVLVGETGPELIVPRGEG